MYHLFRQLLIMLKFPLNGACCAAHPGATVLMTAQHPPSELGILCDFAMLSKEHVLLRQETQSGLWRLVVYTKQLFKGIYSNDYAFKDNYSIDNAIAVMRKRPFAEQFELHFHVQLSSKHSFT